jgi:hypothetical protein
MMPGGTGGACATDVFWIAIVATTAIDAVIAQRTKLLLMKFSSGAGGLNSALFAASCYREREIKAPQRARSLGPAHLLARSRLGSRHRMIEARGLTKRYSGQDAVAGIDL